MWSKIKARLPTLKGKKVCICYPQQHPLWVCESKLSCYIAFYFLLQFTLLTGPSSETKCEFVTMHRKIGVILIIALFMGYYFVS